MLLNLASHPLLQTSNIIKVVKEMEIPQSDFILGNEVPVREIQEHRVAVDVRKGAGGMTQAAASGAESPTVSFYGASQYEFEPAEWREKAILGQKDLYHLRKLGTKQEVQSAQEIITNHLSDLMMRLNTRLEWARWQALRGRLTATGKDLSFDVDYKIPADMQPALTGADLWTASTSDPMDDILEWNEKYRDLMASPQGYWFNARTLRIIMQSSKIRTLRDALFTGQANLGNLTPGNLQAIFNAYAGVPYTSFDGGYYEITDLASPVAASATTLTVRDASQFAANDLLTIIHRDGDIVGRERLTVDSVNTTTNVITVDAPGVVRSAGFPAGSTIRAKKYFIPDGTFIIKGQLPASIEGGPNWAEIISTLHPYGPGGILSPEAGIFAKPVIHEDSDPPRVELIVGIKGLPIVYHRDVNVIASVYTP